MNNSDVANILKQDLERKEFIGVKTEIVLSSQGYVINDIPTFTNDASKKYLAEQDKKTKKKNPVAKDGGTFRGKKSTKRFGK